MQMTSEARAWLDATVRRILSRYPLGDPERLGLTYEIMSHLHGAGEAHATKAGRSEVAKEDLEAALADAEGEEGLAVDRVQPMSRPLERVLFWRRVGAFAIDTILLLLLVALVHSAVTSMVGAYVDELPADASDAKADGSWGLMPWGFHDPTLGTGAQALIATLSAGLVLGYFTWLEGHDGRSLGKRVLQLRVMRVDGSPMTYGAAFVRNLVKLSPPFLLLDTLAMLVLFSKTKQRVSDRIADTIVVRA
jgi:uncharacterized RDD family membrane protein YckC